MARQGLDAFIDERASRVAEMNDEISVYNGTSSYSNFNTTWMEALETIQNGSFANEIAKARSIVDLEEYRKYKQTLPAVTFCGKFKSPRGRDNILEATGFIIADIDHIDDVDGTFSVICNDPYVWFAFRSPSGTGIKVGLRHASIKCDDDIKSFYSSMEYYFKETYNVITDKSCKDISRLTFLSHDPQTFINTSAEFFPIEEWTPPAKERQQSGGASPDSREINYAKKVIESCCEKIRYSPSGQQHIARCSQARLAGGFAHYLDSNAIWCALESAVEASGAKDMVKAMKDISWGLAEGAKNPLTVPEIVSSETSNACNASNENNGELRLSNGKVTVSNAQVTLSNGGVTLGNADKRPRYEGNLAGDVEFWLKNRTGCVTKREIWDEFGIVHPADKANLRKILHTLIKQEYIYKDSYKNDTYWIKDQEFQWADLDASDPSDCGLHLPLGLHEYMTIPRGSVFLLEGCTNAGKTAFCFNVLRQNFGKDVPLRYVFSEGGPSEVRLRINSFSESFGDSYDQWKENVKYAFYPHNHHQFVKQQNPTGLTVIDYLRAVDGDFTKIGPTVDLIAECAGEGFVMICVQKKTGSTFGVGGQNNHFAPRNVFTLEFVSKENGIDFCYLKIAKCKYPRDHKNNPDGKEVHFCIENGVKITPLCKPMFFSEQERKNAFAKYRVKLLGGCIDEPPFFQ